MINPDLTKTFSGESLGFKAEIYFQEQAILETTVKEITGSTVSFEEGFEL